MQIAFNSSVEQQSAVNYVESLLNRAIALNASDIHLEPNNNQLRVRYRIDGVLYDQETIAQVHTASIISRIKILAHIDITQKRIPQDGKFQVAVPDRTIDIRVSTFPSVFGQKVVIRILDRLHLTLSLDQLGLSSTYYAALHSLLTKQHGLLLVTGPTGSGKTTTLYAALSLLNNKDKNIITLEDPVECTIDGITQGNIQPDVGFTFAKGIRAMLRQDPDIVMIGEIRDAETAQTAIEAALTGHLVLSTLHTNDAPAALMRLMDMGIEPFLLNASLSGIVAQRLARMLCTQCRYSYEPTAQEKDLLKRINLKCDQLYASKGCDKCFGLGYKGRTGIFELLHVTNNLRSHIVHRPNIDQIYAQAYKDGLKPLLEDAQEKVKNGIISLQELSRLLL